MKPTRLEAPRAIAASTALNAARQAYAQPIPEKMCACMDEVMRLADVLTDVPFPSDRLTAQRIDYALDRTVSQIGNYLALIVKNYRQLPIPLSESGRRHLADAETLQHTLFPKGVKAITCATFVGEWEIVQSMCRAVRENAELQGMVERLGLSDDFKLLGELHELYGKRLGITSRRQKDPNELLDEWYQAYCKLLICAEFFGMDTPPLRELARRPYDEQVEQQAHHRRSTQARAQPE